MKFSKKTLIMAVSMILCMAMTGLGTVAYLTDKAAVANTFTVGNIQITVDEAVVDEYGEDTEKKLVDITGDGVADEVTKEEYEKWVNDQVANGADRDDFEAYDALESVTRTEKGNKYKLVPGRTYKKDPTMTVMADSEEAYVRMVVRLTNATQLKAAFGEDFKLENYVDWKSDVWPFVSKTENTTDDELVYVFKYNEVVKTSDKAQILPALFTELTIPAEITPEQLKELSEFNIIVEGWAIQTAAFDGNEDQAWVEFDEQMNKGN